jgi:hypothetical protein
MTLSGIVDTNTRPHTRGSAGVRLLPRLQQVRPGPPPHAHRERRRPERRALCSGRAPFLLRAPSLLLTRPQTGLVPRLLRTLGAHRALAQDAANARARRDALHFLAALRARFRALEELVASGRLADAAEAAAALDGAADAAPHGLARAELLLDFRVRRRALAVRAPMAL